MDQVQHGLDRGCFAGTVSPDKAGDLTFFHGKGDIIQPASLSVETEKPAVCTKRSFILTAGGTVALDGEVRKNSYYSDAKQYDYFDTMSLLKKEIQSDLNIVFLENLLSEDGRSSDLIATNAAAAMLKGAGFNLAACGFARAYEKEQAGILAGRQYRLVLLCY